jgi:hypothetical protein
MIINTSELLKKTNVLLATCKKNAQKNIFENVHPYAEPDPATQLNTVFDQNL